MSESFQKLNEEDRHNLCDIAWFIKGLNFKRDSHESPFCGDHEQSLEKVIRAISDKVRLDQPKVTKD